MKISFSHTISLNRKKENNTDRIVGFEGFENKEETN